MSSASSMTHRGLFKISGDIQHNEEQVKALYKILVNTYGNPEWSSTDDGFHSFSVSVPTYPG